MTPPQSQSVTRGAEPHLDAELLERAPAASDSAGSNGVQQPRSRLDQDDARRARIDRAEVGGQRALGELGDGAGHLHAGGPAADDRRN